MRSVQRALDILSLLTEDQPSVSIRDIVEATGLAKTTVIRLVQTLEQSGLLWATASGYMAGPGLWRWAHLARRSWELPPETQRMMRDLAARQRETVNVYVARDIYRVCIAQQESPQPLRHVVHVGDELPLWAGASSKVLLRDAPARAAGPHRPQLAVRRGARRAAAGVDRRGGRTGFAVSHGEREDGPVRGRRAGHWPVRRGRGGAVAQRADDALHRRAHRRSSSRTSGRSRSGCPSAASTTRSARPSEAGHLNGPLEHKEQHACATDR